MTLYVLDTDTVSLLLSGNVAIRRRIVLLLPKQLATTIVTVEELLSGWYSKIRRARNDSQRVRAYGALHEAVEFLCQVQILPFDAAAADRASSLRSQFRRAGKNDLRIAAVVLVHRGILVTGNTRDFESIPGLAVENWSADSTSDHGS